MSVPENPESTPATPAAPAAAAPATSSSFLSSIEKVFLGIVATVPAGLPVFVHSTNGILLANVGEALFSNILQQFAPKQ